MIIASSSLRAAVVALSCCLSWVAQAAEYPAPKRGTFTVKDFRFSTGETLPEPSSAMRRWVSRPASRW